MQFEGIRSISMGGVFLQVLWEVDDHDSVKGAFLRKSQSIIPLYKHTRHSAASTPYLSTLMSLQYHDTVTDRLAELLSTSSM